jgi:hypothetical protein
MRVRKRDQFQVQRAGKKLSKKISSPDGFSPVSGNFPGEDLTRRSTARANCRFLKRIEMRKYFRQSIYHSPQIHSNA